MEVNIDFVWLWSLFALTVSIVYWYASRPWNLPPGPAGLPVVGYLPFMDELLHKTFNKLSQKYGNVFHLYLGSKLVVVLNDHSSIYEAFVKNAEIFTGRPRDVTLKLTTSENLGVLSNDGVYWREHRRFILSNLRNYGFGKMTFEPLILEEIYNLSQKLKANTGKSYPIKSLLTSSTLNNILIMVTGKRLDYNDPVLLKFIDDLREGETRLPIISPTAFFPWLSKLPGANIFLQHEQIRQYLDSTIETSGKLASPAIHEYADGLQDNYIHAYLSERQTRITANGNDDIFTETGLNHITRDLFVAGAETTSSTLLFGLFYMTLHPEIQQKVQKEIDAVIGIERQPSYNDRANMPYTQATILEIHRKSSLVPLSLAHRNKRKVAIQGHTIPVNTMVLPNLWAVHNDPKLFGDPENFRPERFIGLDGKYTKSEYVIPFSIGQRACVGEPLAKMEMFLYFVSLLQQFTFIPPDGKMPLLDVHSGIATRPKYQNICAVLRR